MRLWCELAWLGGDAPVAGVAIDVAEERGVRVPMREGD